MKKIYLLLFLLPSSLVAGDSVPYYEKVGSQALAKVKCDWQTLLADWSISFLPGRDGYLGMADKDTHHIDVWVREDEKPAQVAGVIVHELAHRVDRVFLTKEQKARWYALRGIPAKTPWYSEKKLGDNNDFPPSDYATGAGDFAECVKWTYQGSSAGFSSQLGRPPTQLQQQTIRQWFAQLKPAGP